LLGRPWPDEEEVGAQALYTLCDLRLGAPPNGHERYDRRDAYDHAEQGEAGAQPVDA
jgi:hypothetical protein